MTAQGRAFIRDWSEGRDYLQGRAVYCGACLKLLRGDKWIDGTECVRWPEFWE